MVMIEIKFRGERKQMKSQNTPRKKRTAKAERCWKEQGGRFYLGRPRLPGHEAPLLIPDNRLLQLDSVPGAFIIPRATRAVEFLNYGIDSPTLSDGDDSDKENQPPATNTTHNVPTSTRFRHSATA